MIILTMPQPHILDAPRGARPASAGERKLRVAKLRKPASAEAAAHPSGPQLRQWPLRQRGFECGLECGRCFECPLGFAVGVLGASQAHAQLRYESKVPLRAHSQLRCKSKVPLRASSGAPGQHEVHFNTSWPYCILIYVFTRAPFVALIHWDLIRSLDRPHLVLMSVDWPST